MIPNRFLGTILLALIAIAINGLTSAQSDEEAFFTDPTLDDFKIGGHIFDTIEEELLSRERGEPIISTTTEQTTHRGGLHHFGKTCPLGFFACDNGECLSPKWRCDGHYDCDDFSDETNCTDRKIEPISLSERPLIMPAHAPSHTEAISAQTESHLAAVVPPPPPPRDEISKPKFNSTVEPLMLFSTGSSIRGYWMSTRLYFDVFSTHTRSTPLGSSTIGRQHQSSPSLTQALSIFFGIFDPERSSQADKPPATSPVRASASNSGTPFLRNVNGAPTPKPTSLASVADELAKTRSTIVGVDMDPENKEVYWVELGKDAGVFSIMIDQHQLDPRHRRQLHSQRTLVEFGLLSPEDVALDTIGKNLYITDAGLPAIVVCSVKHSDCKIIVKDKLQKPRAIIVDPTTGWLMYTDWGDHPGIFLVSMDGVRRETLIDTDIAWPNGLAADYTTSHLYWADAKLSKIERIDLDNRKRRIIIRESNSNPFSLSLFENRLYWSDWSGNNIKSCDKVTGNSTQVIMHAENIYGIHIFHPNIYAKSQQVDHLDNPCWSKRCSHMCLLRPRDSANFTGRRTGAIEASCACPESMSLGLDSESSICYTEELSFVLIAVKNYVAQMFPEHIGLETLDRILYSSTHVIHDVAPDWHSARLFFFDAARKLIFQLSLPDIDASRPAHVEKFFSVASSVRSMIYDSASENLYWLEPDTGTLAMSSTKTKFRALVRRHLDSPSSMVLDRTKRVFYIALLGDSPHIMRTNIHADDAHDVIITDDVGLPVCLHLDEHIQRLYWADARHETIESVDLDISAPHGYRHESRLVHRHRVGFILAFTVYKNNLIWTIKNGDYLFKAPMTDTISGTHFIRSSDEPRPVAYKLPPNPSTKEPVSDNVRILLVDPQHGPEDECTKSNCAYACTVEETNQVKCLCPGSKGGYVVSNQTGGACPDAVVATGMSPIAMMPHSGVGHIIMKPGGIYESGAFIPQHAHANYHSSHGEQVNPSNMMGSSQTHKEFMGHADSLHIEQAELNQHHEGGTVWPIVLLLLLSITALITIVSLLILYKQGRLPRQVSQLSVSFRPASFDKDGAMLLLDSDA